MAAAVAAITMRGSSSKINCESKQQAQQSAVFHDFLGAGASGSDGSRNCETDPPVVLVSEPTNKTNRGSDAAVRTDDVVRLSEASPSASGSVGVASGGGRGPFSIVSDLGSERQVGGKFERMARYGPRGDISLSERFAGSKRSNSDSVYTGTSREGSQQINPDSVEKSHLTKMLRNGIGGDRLRISHYDGPSHAVPPIRPGSSSFMLQQSAGLNADANLSRWEPSVLMNVGGSLQYGPRVAQASPLGYAQVASNRVKDGNPGPSILSQTAADEGSRTGIKGSGILNSINASKAVLEKNSSELIPSSSKLKAATRNSEPESFTPAIQQGLISASRQMTVVYGGQVHVFDDVHPNKADVIMALAGSNGGSWSINLPKSSARTNFKEQHNGENDPGGSQCGNMVDKDTRVSIQTLESNMEQKRNV